MDPPRGNVGFNGQNALRGEVDKMNTFGVIKRVASRAMRYVWVAIAILFGAIALQSKATAQDFIPYHEDPTPDYGPVYNGITNCYDAPGGIASFCPNANAGTANSNPVPKVDPCFIAQNAMRPCTPEPIGVDPKTVGIWKLQFKGGPGVWEINRNGTYNFHSEAGDGALPHEGKFAASNGRWLLKATNGYTDAGTYRFQGPDTWIATGQLGTAPWHLDSFKAASSKPVPSVTVKPQPAIPSRRAIDPPWEPRKFYRKFCLSAAGDCRLRFHRHGRHRLA
jgi:hypothetical protein